MSTVIGTENEMRRLYLATQVCITTGAGLQATAIGVVGKDSRWCHMLRCQPTEPTGVLYRERILEASAFPGAVGVRCTGDEENRRRSELLRTLKYTSISLTKEII
jgi:hypothetical protein